jgi:hypothetical protein
MFFSVIADLKDILEVTLHLSRDALHVHLGLAIFLACAAALPGERRFQVAFLLLLGLCLFGEVVDVSLALRSGETPRWLGSAKDIVNTMFWPAAWLAAGPAILRLLDLGRRPAAASGGVARNVFQDRVR